MKMKTASAETTKTYKRQIPNTWWLKSSSYFLFMVREVSSVFVALFALCLFSQVYAVSRGPDHYAAWISGSQSGWMILLHIVILLFVLYHTVTWFRISGRIFGGGALSPAAVTVVNYIVWIAASVVIAFLILRG